MSNRDAVIVAWGRAPIGKGFKGSLAKEHPLEYASQVLNGVLAKVPMLNHDDIDDVIVGCAMPYMEQGDNIGRLVAERAGLPFSVPGQTVNRLCSSGLQAIASAANAIRCGSAEVIIAGGVEAMSLLPMGSPPEKHNKILEETIPGAYMPMGITAENVAEQYKVTREEMDSFAAKSHEKAYTAMKNGWFSDQIIPVQFTKDDGNKAFLSEDEGVRPETTPEKLATLKPCFKEDGKVTAATSSQISDSTSFIVIMSRSKAEEIGAPIEAVFKEYAVAGIPPEIMGVGPLYAIPKVLDKINLPLNEIDVFEINEAFAAQVIPCIKELKLDEEKVNPCGGAIALGHPLGATGAILTCKVISHLKRTGGRFGLVTMCIGGGMGAAAVFEREE